MKSRLPEDQGPDDYSDASVPLGELAGPRGGDESRRLAAFWKDQVDQLDQEQKRWVTRGKRIVKRYRDERQDRTDDLGSRRRYASLWSNVEILFPALYGKEPLPIVDRRFKDRDPTARAAAQILERALRNEQEFSGIDEAISRAVKDYLLPGRGAAWVRYEPEHGEDPGLPAESQVDMRDAQGPIEEIDEDDEEEHFQETGDRVLRESAPVDYLDWKDFYYFPAKARTWAEVVAVGKRVYRTRDQNVARFGKKIGRAIPLTKDARDKRAQREDGGFPAFMDEASQRSEVFEVWNRLDRKVYWFAEGYQFLLDCQDDFLGLEQFFPCPRPLHANGTNDTLTPVPDYAQYQDQAIQVDELTQRISMLSKACRVAGVYNAQSKDIPRLLDESLENQLVPVDAWAAFAEKGGVAGQMAFLPLKDIIGVINELSSILDRQLAMMDKLTGITDIMRGTTDARETMGGQRLKTNGSNTRISARQREVARFARDIVRLQAEVMANKFSAESLIEASGAMFEDGLGMDATPVPVSYDDLPSDIQQRVQPPAPRPLPPPAPHPVVGGPPGGPPAPPGAGAPPQPRPMMPGAPGIAPAAPPQPQAPAPPPAPPQMMVPRGLLRIMHGVDLLRNRCLRGFRIGIETDSTVSMDQEADKASRVEFVAAVTKFLQQAMAVAAQMPEAAPLMAKLLQFAVRGFRVGRDLEAAIDDFAEEAEKKAKEMQANPQQNPQQVKAAADAEKAKAGVAQQQLENQGDAARAAAEVQRQQLENQGEQANAMADLKGKMIDAQVKERDRQDAAEVRDAKSQLDREKLDLERMKIAQRDREMELEFAREENRAREIAAGRMAEAGRTVQ